MNDRSILLCVATHRYSLQTLKSWELSINNFPKSRTGYVPANSIDVLSVASLALLYSGEIFRVKLRLSGILNQVERVWSIFRLPSNNSNLSFSCCSALCPCAGKIIGSSKAAAETNTPVYNSVIAYLMISLPSIKKAINC